MNKAEFELEALSVCDTPESVIVALVDMAWVVTLKLTVGDTLELAVPLKLTVDDTLGLAATTVNVVVAWLESQSVRPIMPYKSTLKTVIVSN